MVKKASPTPQSRGIRITPLTSSIRGVNPPPPKPSMKPPPPPPPPKPKK